MSAPQYSAHIIAMINSAFFVIICATSFALAQTATSESSSVAVTVSLTCNTTATVEEQRACLADDRSVQYGTHSFVLVFHSQPHSLGFGISGVLERDCFQIKAATSRARLICWNKAFLVGGMESRDVEL